MAVWRWEGNLSGSERCQSLHIAAFMSIESPGTIINCAPTPRKVFAPPFRDSSALGSYALERMLCLFIFQIQGERLRAFLNMFKAYSRANPVPCATQRRQRGFLSAKRVRNGYRGYSLLVNKDTHRP